MPNRRAHQLALERVQQVLDLVLLLDLDVLVAGDAERVLLDDLHAGEQLVEVRGDDVLERDEPGALPSIGHEPRQQRRHLDPGEVLAAGRAVAHEHREVEREPGDVRERVRRVDRQRGQHRVDPLAEEVVQLLALVGVELRPVQDLDALVGEVRLVTSANSAACRRRARRTGARSGRAARARSARTGSTRASPVASRRLRPATRTMKNSSRLPAKIARNRTRSSSGTSGSRGELEHPLVEVEPAGLAVEEPVGGQLAVDRGRGFGPGVVELLGERVGVLGGASGAAGVPAGRGHAPSSCVRGRLAPPPVDPGGTPAEHPGVRLEAWFGARRGSDASGGASAPQ